MDSGHKTESQSPDDYTPTTAWTSFAHKRSANLHGLTSYSDREVIAHAERQLAREIDAVQAALLVLRSQKNNISLLARVPHEVFSEIFAFLAVGSPPGTHNALGWIVVTHVCHRWRAIALRDSSLWKIVDHDMGPQWMKIRLARSEPIPIHLELRFPLSGSALNDEVLTVALSQLHRIERLGLYDNILQANFELIRDLLAQDSATLRKIVIVSSSHFVLTTDTFTGNFPNLRSMTLRDTQVTWDGSIFAGLASLTMVGKCVKKPEIGQMLAVLGGMPSLQNLTLSNILPDAEPGEDNWTARSGPTQLKSLRYLKLNDNLLQCAQFLASVRLPMDASLSLTIQCDEALRFLGRYVKEIICVVLRLSFRTRIGVPVTLQSLTISCGVPSNQPIGMQLELVGIPHKSSEMQHSEEFHFRKPYYHLCFVVGKHGDQPATYRNKLEQFIVPAVFKGLDVPKLVHVKVDVEPLSVHYDYFAWAFRNAIYLSRVFVAGSMGADFWSDLQYCRHLLSANDSSLLSTKEYPFHHARTIKISRADLSRFPGGLSKEIVEERVSMGTSPIAKIMIKDCIVRPNFVADCTRALASRKGTVVWDGKGVVHVSEDPEQEDNQHEGSFEGNDQ
ncbi:uncharacterized protein STEHIDRAFT_139598 [Stereum hirsutum FP-91666 SS1]|uniref:uncharacterized protein n=1 Tax=Stereum hirsutum (strain FP-91666) TaxID=721885 RepID=UPI000444A25E|nr:uncharacterized protein STEHIDRAFT_139598 [Stereum hirsutum FP-91666 SS1]EIM86881.1 hypothetical protein STEHIDRAFT_139598 [Stereum hirsutum FP-91666 SS1]